MGPLQASAAIMATASRSAPIPDIPALAPEREVSTEISHSQDYECSAENEEETCIPQITQREFLVQDPDGYLLRFAQALPVA